MDRTRTGRGSASDSYDPNIDASGKSLFWRFVAGLNKLLNPGHAWTDYSSKPEESALHSALINARHQVYKDDLTGAEKAANAFSADEAQKQRDFEEYMSSTAYQRQVKDMQAAGVNPAMAMNANGASTPSGVSASSVSPQSGMSLSDLMQLILLPMQRKLLDSQAQMFRDQGTAALRNAGANERNAGANERNAGTNERNAGTNEQNANTAKFEAETRRMLKDIEERKTGIYESLTEEQKKEIAERAAYIKLQREQLPEQLEVAKRNATSSERQAIASLQQAEASVQNAATNDRLADYETSLKYANELLVWAEKDGRVIINKYLDERQRTELDNLYKEGIRIDKQGRLYDKTGRYLDSQMVRNYVESACSVSNAVNKWVNPLSGMSSAMPSDWTVGSSVAPGASLMMTGGI